MKFLNTVKTKYYAASTGLLLIFSEISNAALIDFKSASVSAASNDPLADGKAVMKDWTDVVATIAQVLILLGAIVYIAKQLIAVKRDDDTTLGDVVLGIFVAALTIVITGILLVQSTTILA